MGYPIYFRRPWKFKLFFRGLKDPQTRQFPTPTSPPAAIHEVHIQGDVRPTPSRGLKCQAPFLNPDATQNPSQHYQRLTRAFSSPQKNSPTPTPPSKCGRPRRALGDLQAFRGWMTPFPTFSLTVSPNASHHTWSQNSLRTTPGPRTR